MTNESLTPELESVLSRVERIAGYRASADEGLTNRLTRGAIEAADKNLSRVTWAETAAVFGATLWAMQVLLVGSDVPAGAASILGAVAVVGILLASRSAVAPPADSTPDTICDG